MASIRPYHPFTTDPKTGNRHRSDKPEGWLLNWKDHRGKWRQKVFRGDKRSAEKFLQRIASEVDQITAGIKPPPERSIGLDKAISTYLRHLERTKRSPATVRRYAKSHKVFQRFMPSAVKLQDIRRRDIERFRAMRLETCTDAAVNLDLRQLKAFFNWCYGMELIHRSPFVGVKINTHVKPVRFLSRDEIQALYDVIQDDKDALDLVTFYLSTGARATEILPPRFTWANVHQHEITLIGKGNKVRHVGLNDTLREILESRKHLEVPFRFTHDGVYEKIVRKYYRLAGIFDADLHTLRKTAGALLIQEGVDIYRVSKFLGHSSVTTTEKHYVDLLRQDYQDIARIMERRLRSDPEMIPIFQPIPAHSGVGINQDQDEHSEMAALEDENISPRISKIYEDLEGVPGPGLEPGSLLQAGDFKSPVSTNSTTPAAQVDFASCAVEATTGFEPVNSGFADRPLRPLGYVALRL